ncbi:hypothetical protein PROFUN_00521 [Planoprotostelium fungivorum]|uniref:E3 ubiquitin-protein ligase listerin n=1 Tax=Planoprotostelium fungivorum TaxID=1890364 RepID=A0A2P6N183_9EUKA|nr:hypothetical protein PROFUN_00521 [Planoprotostelium fungivorum]
MGKDRMMQASAGFVGFGGGTSNLSQALNETNSAMQTQHLDGPFQLAFKSIQKRDEITKVKALQELSTYFKNMNDDTKPHALKLWTIYYPRLCADNSRKVRENTHLTMNALVASVGKSLAPHLKKLMPHWILCKHDPCKEVSRAATAAFESALSESKRIDGLLFCKNEIIENFNENFKSTPQSMQDAKLTIEEATERYERTIYCTMISLGYFVQTLPKAENDKLLESYSSLFNPKSWESFLNSKHNMIKRAAYSLITVLCTHLKDIFTSDMAAWSKIVMAVIAERDGGSQQSAWECILTFTRVFPESWEHVNARKAVFPRLFATLRETAPTSHSIIYPSILPFISHIPDALVGREGHFQRELFTNFWKGAHTDHGGPAAFRSLLNAYLECLSFYTSQYKDEAQHPLSSIPSNEHPLLAPFDDFVNFPKHPIPTDEYAKTLANSIIKLASVQLSDVNYTKKTFDQLSSGIRSSLDQQTKSTDTQDQMNRISSLISYLKKDENERIRSFVEDLCGAMIRRCTEELNSTNPNTRQQALQTLFTIVSSVGVQILTGEDGILEKHRFFSNEWTPCLQKIAALQGTDDGIERDISLLFDVSQVYFRGYTSEENDVFSSHWRNTLDIIHNSSVRVSLLEKCLEKMKKVEGFDLRDDLLDRSIYEEISKISNDGNSSEDTKKRFHIFHLALQSDLVGKDLRLRMIEKLAENSRGDRLTGSSSQEWTSVLSDDDVIRYSNEIPKWAESTTRIYHSLHSRSGQKKNDEIISEEILNRYSTEWKSRLHRLTSEDTSKLLSSDASNVDDLQRIVSSARNVRELSQVTNKSVQEYIQQISPLQLAKSREEVLQTIDLFNLRHVLVYGATAPSRGSGEGARYVKTMYYLFGLINSYGTKEIFKLENDSIYNEALLIELMYVIALRNNLSEYFSDVSLLKGVIEPTERQVKEYVKEISLLSFPLIQVMKKNSIEVGGAHSYVHSYWLSEFNRVKEMKHRFDEYVTKDLLPNVEQLSQKTTLLHTLDCAVDVIGDHYLHLIPKCLNQLKQFRRQDFLEHSAQVTRVMYLYSSLCLHSLSVDNLTVDEANVGSEILTYVLDGSKNASRDSWFLVSSIRLVLSQFKLRDRGASHIMTPEILQPILNLVTLQLKVEYRGSSDVQRVLIYNTLDLFYSLQDVTEQTVFPLQHWQSWNHENWTRVIHLTEKVTEKATDMREDLLKVILSCSKVIPSSVVSASLDTNSSIYHLLLSPHVPLQNLAFHIVSLYNEAEAAKPFTLPSEEEDIENVIVDGLLDMMNVQYPLEEGQVLEFGYLLGWAALFRYVNAIKHKDRRNAMIIYLRKHSLLSRFLTLLFIPMDTEESPSESVENLNIGGIIKTRNIQSLCLWLYYQAIRNFPVLVRQWFNDDCEGKMSQSVERFTSKYVSPTLCSQELNSLSAYQSIVDEFSITVPKGSNLVVAKYQKEELSLTISIQFPPSFPLRSAEVGVPERSGVSESQYRRWILSMITLLSMKDSPVLDAILLWKSSLDRHFEGVEVCPICYSLFDPSNHLPALSCKTCRNKFHSSCMYKWIKVSHKNDCPLCKTPFN